MDTTHENIIWMAGLLEGEGYFCKGYKSRPNQAAISVEMTDEDIIEKLSNLWGVCYCACKIRKSNWKQTFKVQIRGKNALEWMRKVKPYMGKRRTAKIDEILLNNGEQTYLGRSSLLSCLNL